MNNTNRLGCLTGSGFVAAFITLFVLVGVAFASGSQMFSSGALNAQPGEPMGGVASHAEITECKVCHSAPWERASMANRCLECHTNVAAQMLDVAQLHGSIVQKSPSLACRDCHKEHRGQTASLTDLGENTFPHESFGFTLDEHTRMESGEPITCDSCHGEDLTVFASDSCQSCHSDLDIVFTQTHVLSFGNECLACHDGVDRFDDFNHNAYPFKLEGGHADDIPCTKCHLDARSISDLQSASQDCFSCHAQDDQHNGGYGTSCESCHNPGSWEDAIFDHNLSAFRLEGEHAEAACEEGHADGVFKGTPRDCYSCHSGDDEHNGRYGTQCEACHTPSDWEDAAFDHVRMAAVNACVDCHAEPQEHAGQFGTDCAACHSTSAWEPASYNGTHTFPLGHGDGNGSCQTCHPTNLATYTCYGCHEHNEANVASEHREEGITDFQNCIECHIDGREHEGGGDDD